MNLRSRAFSAFALLAAGLLVVHELRYSFGADGTHGYIAYAAPAIGLLVLAAIALFVRRVHRAATGHREDPIPQLKFLPAWVSASGILTGAFFVQETLEGALGGNDDAGTVSLFGQNGWIAPLAAIVVGAAIAFLLRSADAVVARVARANRGRANRVPPTDAFSPLTLLLRPHAVVAENLAGRAPPLTA